ncbi:MAG: tRNA (adenosine(37)-N6)-dimethylallyltransferase MiaA [Bacteroidetes bacterium]|nr:tRNA (adenosine(37)-N6)-dimethylallyltransferase MiaA [Bacteroidota bacterium]
MQPKPLLVCIVGPTAIGKTSLSIKIANAFDAEIISADSRQFYKEMRIGTAVPSEEELAAAPHHFIQNRSIHQDYSVGDFEKEAISLLTNVFKKNPIVVMVGGSGLYVDAVTRGLDYFPEVDPAIRIALNKRYETEGLLALQKELKELDPTYFAKVDIENHHRLIRALEICIGSGAPYSSFLNRDKQPRDFDVLYIGLNADRDIVYDRINRRVDIMMSEGLLEEARQLYPHKALNALQTVGYRELFQYFDGVISEAEAISEIKKNTRRFAKRQGTWFRKNTDIYWFDYADSPIQAITLIKTKAPFLP